MLENSKWLNGVHLAKRMRWYLHTSTQCLPYSNWGTQCDNMYLDWASGKDSWAVGLSSEDCPSTLTCRPAFLSLIVTGVAWIIYLLLFASVMYLPLEFTVYVQVLNGCFFSRPYSGQWPWWYQTMPSLEKSPSIPWDFWTPEGMLHWFPSGL